MQRIWLPFALFLLLLSSSQTYSLPRFSLMTGMTCASCHESVTGGGLRTPGGSDGFRSFSLVSPSSALPSFLQREESSTLLDGLMTWGFDIRYQIAKRANEKGELRREFFGMQITPAVSFRPFENLTVHGAVNVVEPLYPAQQHFVAAVTWKPVEELALQSGFIEPAFGLRHDDHTLYWMRFAGPSPQGIPPFLQDLGFIAQYSPLPGVEVTGGIYDSRNMRELIGNLTTDPYGTLQLNLRHGIEDVQVLLGGSHMFRRGAAMSEFHGGVGLLDLASLVGEWVRYDNSLSARNEETQAFSLIGTVHLMDGIAFEARMESAVREIANARLEYDQYVAGFQIFVLPWLELRPEYRYSESPGRVLAQYTGQVHLFY